MSVSPSGWTSNFTLGPYVLTGGELPAMTIVDSVVRLLPGVLGGAESAEIESFQQDDQAWSFRSIRVQMSSVG